MLWKNKQVSKVKWQVVSRQTKEAVLNHSNYTATMPVAKPVGCRDPPQRHFVPANQQQSVNIKPRSKIRNKILSSRFHK